MTGMSTGQKGATRHWLLPHEHWLGRFAGRAGEPPGGQAWRFQQNYGPEGNALVLASAADLMAALMLCLVGFTCLGASGDRGPLAAAGYWIVGIGILSGIVAMVRGCQLIHAGRVFRAGRPFIRPGRR
jgi:hypothetical protein